MIVDKYVKALLLALKDDDEVVKVYEAIAKLSLVAKNPKFILLVKSPMLSIDEKVNFLTKITECENEKFKNFLKILIENKRIDLLKDIFKKLYTEVSRRFNTYAGVVIGKVSEETLKSIEEKLSKEFNATIKLKLKDADIKGIKVLVDVLDVEISVVEDRIKQNLINTIIKAI